MEHVTMRMPLALALSSILMLLAGCASLDDLVRSRTPDADLVGVRLADLTAEGVTLDLDVDVTNPNEVPLPIGAFEYAVTSGGAKLAAGDATLADSIPARGTGRVQVPVALRFDDVLAALRDVRPGAVVPYDVAATITLDAGPVGPIAVPLRRRGELPVPAAPSVSLAGVRWTELGLSGARAELDLVVDNPNDFGLDLDELGSSVALAGRSVARARVAPGTALPAGGAGRVTVPIELDPGALGAAFLRVLGGDRLEYALDGEARVGTPFGPLDLPIRGRGSAPVTGR